MLNPWELKAVSKVFQCQHSGLHVTVATDTYVDYKRFMAAHVSLYFYTVNPRVLKQPILSNHTRVTLTKMCGFNTVMCNFETYALFNI